MIKDLIKSAFATAYGPPSDPEPMHAGEYVQDLATRMGFLAALLGTPYDNWMVMTDDSYWKPSVDYTLLSAMGVDTFLLRGGGPTTWSEGMYSPKEDPTYFSKFPKARATGRSVGGYYVHNAGEMINNFKDPKAQIDLMKKIFYGAYKPDYLVLDVEINYFYRGNNTIFIPQPNYADSVKYTLEAMWEEFKTTIFLYSRVSFLKEAGGTYLQSWLDTQNKGEIRFPLHLAVYPTAAAKADVIDGADDWKSWLPAITPAFRQYLEWGATSWDRNETIWQAVTTAKTAAARDANGKITSLDWNLMPKTADQWEEYIGFSAPTPPPEEEPGDGGDGQTGEYMTRGEFDKFLATQYHKHEHKTGAPV